MRPFAGGFDGYENRAAPNQRAVANGARQVGVVGAGSRMLPCACGGTVVVLRPVREADLISGIRSHQGTAQHAAWWERHRAQG